jgi:hypothetical protein
VRGDESRVGADPREASDGPPEDEPDGEHGREREAQPPPRPQLISSTRRMPPVASTSALHTNPQL